MRRGAVRPIVAIRMRWGKRSTTTYALLDNCATDTYVLTEKARMIRAKLDYGPSRVTTVGSQSYDPEAAFATFTIEALDGSITIKVEKALMGDLITSKDELPPTNEDIKDYDYMKDVSFEDLEDKTIGMIISAKHAWTWLQSDLRFGNTDQPIAMRSLWGWSIIGPTVKKAPKQPPSSFALLNIEKASIREEIDSLKIHDFEEEDFCDKLSSINVEEEEMENLTVQESLNRIIRHDYVMRDGEKFSHGQTHYSANDEASLRQMDETAKYDLDENRYSVGIPWIGGREKAAEAFETVDSYSNAYNRLMKEKVKLKKDPVRKAGVFAQMQEILNEGHARRVDNPDERIPGRPVMYLPIHVVWTAAKPDKWRICLDAAGKVRGIYLNGWCHSGPNYLGSLLGILWRWRRKEFPTTADIKGFYHQVKIDERDSASFRFIWFTDETMTKTAVFEYGRHVFGGASSGPVATYALRHHADKIDGQFETDVKKAVYEQTYVDDVVDSHDSIAEARKYRIEMTEAFRLGGFQLCKWASPYPEILAPGDDEIYLTSRIPEKNADAKATKPDNKDAPLLALDFSNAIKDQTAAEALGKTIKSAFAPTENFGAEFSKMFDPGEEENPSGKVLGMGYSEKGDYLYIKVPEKQSKPIRTLTDLLSLIASQFDPDGRAGPYMLIAKILLQIASNLGLKWKDLLPPEVFEEVDKWRVEMPFLKKFRVPRWTSAVGMEDCETWMVGFSDASLVGYGICIYIRRSLKGEDPDKKVNLSMIMSKSHVTPTAMHVKALKDEEDHCNSVPKLELEACRLLARKRDDVVRESGENFDKILLMTDSQTCLRWVNDLNARHKTYEHFRLRNIWLNSIIAEWNYIGTDYNPADYCSRGLKANDPKWETFMYGPKYLLQDPSTWPTQLPEKPQKGKQQATTPTTTDGEDGTPEDEETFVASRDAEFSAIELIAVGATYADTEVQCDRPEDAPTEHWCVSITKKLENWDDKMVRIAIFTKFLTLAAKRIHEKNLKNTKQVVKISPEDLFVWKKDTSQAENMIIKQIQIRHFEPEIIELLKLGVNTPNNKLELKKKNSRLLTLSPFLDDEYVLRSGGRLGNAAHMGYDQKFPRVLPAKDENVNSLIRHIHFSNAHCTRLQTYHALRERFYILGGRNTVNHAVAVCTVCQRRDKLPIPQRIAELPTARVTSSPPFAKCGMDVFGPFNVRQSGRGYKKKWVLLTTCLVTRAICLTSLFDMSADSFISSLVRFHNQFPGVKEIWADNGTNFTGGSRELNEQVAAWNNQQTNKELVVKGIDFHFGVPNCPHANGVWERGVGLAKKHISAIIHEQKQELSLDSFETILAEVTGCLNRRPIVPVNCDPNSPQVLSPSNILYPGVFCHSSLSIMPPACTGDSIRAAWKQVRAIVEEFWRRWPREYLTLLQAKKKWTSSTANPKLNQICLMVDDNLPREKWRWGIIVELLGTDKNHIRRVRLKMPNGTYFERHVTAIVPLELDE